MWLIPVVLRIFVGHIIAPWMIKKAATGVGREERFMLQFASAALLSVLGVLVFGLSFDTNLLITVGVGFINGFGAYCQWRAIELSLSKTSLFTPGDDLIGMTLAYYFLDEGRLLNTPITLGIMFSFTAVALFSYGDYRQKTKETSTNGAHPLALYAWIAGYSVIWGVAIFCTRLMALEQVAPSTFIAGWYFGALLAAIIIIRMKWRKERSVISRRDVTLSVGLGCVILTALGLNYWALILAPLLVVQPIFLVSEIVFPVLIGLIGFGEKKDYGFAEWCYLCLGILGSFFVVVGFVM
ncbi:MAG: hypothetical protein AAB545_03055 [Patescibacteria group bacterium]